MVVHVKHVGGVGDSKPFVAFNNDEVLVVIEGCLVTKVVTARDDHAIVRERIDHNDFVVNDGEARLQNLLLPTKRNDFIQRLRTDDARILFHRNHRARLLLGGRHAFEFVVERLRCGLVCNAATHKQFLLFLQRLRRPVRDARFAGKECEKQDRVLGFVNLLDERRHVDRLLFVG